MLEYMEGIEEIRNFEMAIHGAKPKEEAKVATSDDLLALSAANMPQ